MNLRKRSNSVILLALLMAISVLLSCDNGGSDSHHADHIQDQGDYQCPMKCEGEKTYPHPGNCPVCKMKMILSPEDMIQAASPSKIVLSRQSTVKLSASSEGKSNTLHGLIYPAKNRDQLLSARFGGRIEKLYVRHNEQFIRKGDKVMEIYSPELRTIQEEHLLLFRSSANDDLLEQSRKKMRLLGLTDQQISHLEKNGNVALTITVFSPYTGYVLLDNESQMYNPGNKQNVQMSSMKMSDGTAKEPMGNVKKTQLREGSYIREGQALFSINDLEEVWAILSVPTSHLDALKNQKTIAIRLESEPDNRMGVISLFEPIYEEKGQRFSRVRITLPNGNKKIKLNTLVSSEIKRNTKGNQFELPSSAVVKTGVHAYVWVKKGETSQGTSIFEIKKVIAGPSNNGRTSILSGLSEKEEVALQAGLMTDSETFLEE